jgi:hypothetical protein
MKKKYEWYENKRYYSKKIKYVLTRKRDRNGKHNLNP